MHDYEHEYEHDLDRTQTQFASALHELKPEHFQIPGEEESFGEAEAASIEHQAGLYRAGFQHPSQEAGELELELAAELLEVTSEEELDRFLRKIFKKVGGFVSNEVKCPVFKALGGVLKPIARAVLPGVGKGLGSAVGGPRGDVIGSKLASAAGKLAALELEGLSGEDREFEMARRFVRLASGAAGAVREMQYFHGYHHHKAAKSAVRQSLQKYFHRLKQRARRRAALRPRPPVPLPPDDDDDDASDMPPEDAGDSDSELAPDGGSRQGTWFRCGRRIVVIGA